MSSYRDAILAARPAGYYPLSGNPRETAFDASGNGRHGRIHGGVKLGEEGPFADSQAASFDGAGFIEISGESFRGWRELTVEAWVSVRETSADPQAIVASTGHSFVQLQLFHDGHIAVYTDRGYVWLPNVEQTPLHVWRHIAVSAAPGNVLLFVDGAQVGSNRRKFTSIRPPDVIRIGAGQGGGRAFRGRISEVAIYDRALSRAQLGARVERAKGAPEPSPAMFAESFAIEDTLPAADYTRLPLLAPRVNVSRAAEQPRVTVSVVEPPPVAAPAVEPPVIEPPVIEPPAVVSFADEPPASEPPAVVSFADEPPASEPPAVVSFAEPPADEPPAAEPPAMEPPPIAAPPPEEPPPPAISPPVSAPVSPVAMASVDVSRDPERLARRGEQIIKDHVAYVAAASFIPLAGVDLVASGFLQLRMLARLTELYGHGHQWDDRLGRQILGVVLADVAGGAAARSLMKLIPPFGLASQIVGPATAGAATLALGRLFHVHYASGGTLLTFNAQAARRQLLLARAVEARP